MSRQHVYQPRGAALAVMGDRSSEVLVAGPAGTGKSLACLEKLNLLMLLNAGARGLIVRKTQVSLASTALTTWRKFVVKELLASGQVMFHGGGPQDAPQYRYPNGSTVTIGGMDRSSRIMSSEYDVVYVQEATELEEEDWEAITTRLRNWVIPFQQVIADCNPATPTHWLKARCDRGVTHLHQSYHVDNPALFTDDGVMTEGGKAYLDKLGQLTGTRKLRLLDGKWVSSEGVIYDDWDEAKHVIEPFPIPVEWPRFWVVDFGFTNPFVLQMWAEDPDGRLYMYREIYHTGRTVDEHSRQVLSLVQDSDGGWLEPKPTKIICDHDAESRAQLRKQLGLSTVAANKKVLEGIQATQRRFRLAEDGRPRMMFFRGALVEKDDSLVEAKRPTCTVEEIPGYIWDTGTGKSPKEQPLKENDHGCDTTRYLAMDRERNATYRVRFVS